MQFSNEVFGGKTLVRTDIQSEGFEDDPENGITGWALFRNGNAIIRSITIGNNNYFITEDGDAAFQNVTVNGTLTVGGSTLETILSAFPQGLLWYGIRDSDSDTTSGASEVAVLEVDTELVSGRMYRISTSEMRVTGTVVGDTVGIRIRDGGSGSPDTSSDQLCLGTAGIVNTGTGGNTVSTSIVISCDDDTAVSYTNYHSGVHRYLLTLARYAGTGTMTLTTNSATVNPIQVNIEDIGPLISNTGIDQSSGGGGTTPVTTVTKTYNATWSGTYNQAGTFRNPGTDPSVHGIYQGYFSSNNGTQKALIGFPYATIVSDLTGAVVNKIEVYLYYSHWYFNGGGTARIGTHNLTNSSAPASFPGSDTTASRKLVTSWGVNVGQWVDVTSLGIGAEFQAGTTKGFMIGGGTSTDQTFYGYADPFGGTHPPQVRITYTK